MQTKMIALFPLTVLAFTFSLRVFASTPVQAWQLAMTDADSSQSVGEHDHAMQSFKGATDLAEKQKLPAKYVAIPLCGLIEEEVLCSQIEPAEANLEKLVSLIKAQSKALLPDPQVNGRISSLADTYQDHQTPKTREICLKNACLLKMIMFGESDKHCSDCMSTLANYYVERGRIDDAVRVMMAIERAKSKTPGKKSASTAVGELLNLMAITNRGEHHYDLSNQLELAVIKLAKANSSDLNTGLPAFYTLLGMNAVAQGNSGDGKSYFAKAIKECRSVRSSNNKRFANQYIQLLVQSANSDGQAGKKWANAEVELKQILAVQQALSPDPRTQYGTLNLLGNIFDAEGKHSESEKCLTRAIAIARLPNSFVEQDVPELYMRMALSRARQKNMKMANESFNEALKAEKDKNGFQSTLVLLYWGCMARDNEQFSLASDKLNMALKMASALPASKRGTLLADILIMLNAVEKHYGHTAKALALLQQSSKEIALQKASHFKLGPDFFHRL